MCLLEKPHAITDLLEKRFTLHDLSDDDHERQVKSRTEVLLEEYTTNPQKQANLT
jgi:hypothetical protein